MLESNINEGTQKLILGEKEKLKYGVSITDACISIDETQSLLKHTFDQLRDIQTLVLSNVNHTNTETYNI